jgi:hypothetical protein
VNIDFLKHHSLETKKIAPNFESARRYKEPSKVALKSDEASLFGEQGK